MITRVPASELFFHNSYYVLGCHIWFPCNDYPIMLSEDRPNLHRKKQLRRRVEECGE